MIIVHFEPFVSSLFFLNCNCLKEVGYLEVQPSSAFVLGELWCVDV